MSDNSPWQSPDSSASSSGPGIYAPSEATTPAPQYGTPTPSWTPPPKPGLIPLRPLGLGTILSASFMVLRRNPRPIFGLALLIMGIVTVASLILVGIVTFSGIDRALSASVGDAATIEAGAIVGVALTALFAVALSVVGASILQGIVSLEVARGAVGERLRLRGLWSAAKGRLWALIGWSALVAIATLILFAIVALVAALLFSIGDTAGIVSGVLAVIFGILVSVALMVWLGTFFALVPSALMIERLPLLRAIGRSWSLVSGSFWRTFGILALIIVIVQVVSSVVTAPVSFIGGIGSTLLDPTGNAQVSSGLFIALYIVTVIITVGISAVTIVIQSAAPALLYIDQRMRKEGFDLELTRFVEARQAGDMSVADPYLTVDSKVARPSQPSPYTAS